MTTTTKLDVTTIAMMTSDQIIEAYKNKSNAIRALHEAGFSRKAISSMLGIRYQHVRNVLITPLKRLGQL